MFIIILIGFDFRLDDDIFLKRAEFLKRNETECYICPEGTQIDPLECVFCEEGFCPPDLCVPCSPGSYAPSEVIYLFIYS